MDTELLSLTKRAEIEREVAHLHLLAAAKANSEDHQAAPQPAKRAAPAIPLRLLRALRLAS